MRLAALTAVALVAVATLQLTMGLGGASQTARAEDGTPLLEPLARSQFQDEIRGFLTVRLAGSHPTRVIHLSRASDAIVAKLTVPPGGTVPWHTHPGAAIAVVAQGELTLTFGGDCVARTYAAGSAFVHGADAEPDQAENLGDEDMIMYVLFLGNPPGPATVLDDHESC
jgi:quercetin dioxygenase-like cupin family protein